VYRALVGEVCRGRHLCFLSRVGYLSFLLACIVWLQRLLAASSARRNADGPRTKRRDGGTPAPSPGAARGADNGIDSRRSSTRAPVPVAAGWTSCGTGTLSVWKVFFPQFDATASARHALHSASEEGLTCLDSSLFNLLNIFSTSSASPLWAARVQAAVVPATEEQPRSASELPSRRSARAGALRAEPRAPERAAGQGGHHERGRRHAEAPRRHGLAWPRVTLVAR
jgi:hypothetical protein